MKRLLRRWAIRWLDLAPGECYRAGNHHIEWLTAELDRCRANWRWASQTIDDFRKQLADCRNDAWRSALDLAKRDAENADKKIGA